MRRLPGTLSGLLFCLALLTFKAHGVTTLLKGLFIGHFLLVFGFLASPFFRFLPHAFLTHTSAGHCMLAGLFFPHFGFVARSIWGYSALRRSTGK